MKIRLLVPIFSVLFTFFFAQVNSIAQENSETKTPIDIMYTGKMLGYFRVPSLQRLEHFKGCYPRSDRYDSEAAAKFLAERDKYPNVLLVGTGDNFSPQLEARIFSDVTSGSGKYAIGNKELYFGDLNDFWFPVSQLKQYPGVEKEILEGHAIIPTDNVGCFLRAAGYAAIVPGKHDFYFGAERVRQFARFLGEPANGNFKPVQMLGANLVMRTNPIKSKDGSSKITEELKFEKWPGELPVVNLKDGNRVYPWFSHVDIELADWTKKGSDLLTRLNAQFPNGSATLDGFISIVGAPQKLDPDTPENKLSRNASRVNDLKLCLAKDGPNDFDSGACDSIPNPNNPSPNKTIVSWKGTKITVTIPLPDKFRGNNGHFSTVMPGKNYFLCTTPTTQKPTCLRFSVHMPFFYHPHIVPETANGYNDPEPFVIKDNIAIFGVVDPALNDQIGVLNAGWRNTQPELTSRLSIEDPTEALREQLDYFDYYYERNFQKKFNGLKVLLAQATPQRAQALGAKFPTFQIVVTAADQQQGTSESERTTVWKRDSTTSSFLAIPTPYFNSSTREGSVHFGMITAIPRDTSWELIANHLEPVAVKEPEDSADKFWDNVRTTTIKECVASNFKAPPDEENPRESYLKWLVLCTMRKQLSADVALVQSRDFYDKIPDVIKAKSALLDRSNPEQTKLGLAPAEQVENIQQMLDRLIWKGDLLTLLYVPGADLRKALKQSDRYAAEEIATFSLAVERGRQLEKLGITEDGDDYLINEVPLDDSRVYTIATTDYIGAGDTGYPDLVSAALNPRTHPAAFNGNLLPISSLVCRKLVTVDPDKFCLGPINSLDYLDETSAEQIASYKPPSRFNRLWKATGLEWPHKSVSPSSTAEAVEQKVQERSFWSFSLKNFSFGFKDLHNNGPDATLDEKFGGISTSGLTAKGSRSYSFTIDTRTSYSEHNTEFFIGNGLEFERQNQGNPLVPLGISQVKNRIFTDVGFVVWKVPGRSLPNLGTVFSVHGETQLQQPFSTFQLSTSPDDQRRINQPRSLIMLGRVGMRWQNKSNTAEIGGQFGRELRALRGYRFESAAGSVECLADSSQTLGDCISTNSKAPGFITMDATATALVQGRPRAGIYWSHTLSIPLGDRLKYEVTQDADYFFVKFHNDTSIDTKFRYSSTNRLSFMFWPNFSIGPTLDLLMFQNKRNEKFLFQRQIGFETKLNFDIFNRREKSVQLKHKP